MMACGLLPTARLWGTCEAVNMTKLKLVVAFAAGTVAGLMVAICAWVYIGRPDVIGGETLILPLIVLLVCFGWNLRIAAAEVKRGLHRPPRHR